MASETMRMSETGLAALRQREHAVLRYYNDVARNCTYGVGTLAHHGPCTTEELQRAVTIHEVNTQLAMKVRAAEVVVRRYVPNTQLTQAQFDALVSFVFNTGATGARTTLDAANWGANDQVVVHLNNNVYVHPHDAHGRRMAAVRIQGLVNRRQKEAAPFKRLHGGAQ